MATTTPNYGWAVPTSTDLVKDGATAIETLGDSIDASMFTALGTKKAGMVLLNTTTFSGVASQSVNDVFSAGYSRYQIVLSQTKSTTTGSMYLRLRVGGADASGVDYKYHTSFAESTTNYQAVQSNGADSYRLTVDNSTTDIQTADILVVNPFGTVRTCFIGVSLNVGGTPAGGQTLCSHGLSTSYTGFTIYASAGSMTGSISVFGYNA